MMSQRSTFLRASGATGFPITQGSMMISFHLAERTFHVPWPTHVKLTSELIAIAGPLQKRKIDHPHPTLSLEGEGGWKSRFSHTPKTNSPIAAMVHRFGKMRSHGAR